ncbi:MAG: Lrp/AsnC family transcriptional regulator [Methylobacillus sp.]|jgi:DNA-binding Lrp family transcriptional regulator|nr:Lrp/AsnC family transcriptional regulator [Methylobacillus sp.]
MDATDRAVVNHLQGGFPVCEYPYRVAAEQLGITEDELLTRLQQLLAEKILTRFGPMVQIERMGGAFSLAAMSVPEADFDHVAEVVNALPEVAHNYQRAHALNMWFVLATETPDGIAATIAKIEAATGNRVLNMPKEREYFVGARFTA